jgi:hypothetical protein
VQALFFEFPAQVRLALGDVNAFDDFARRRTKATAKFHLMVCVGGCHDGRSYGTAAERCLSTGVHCRFSVDTHH